MTAEARRLKCRYCDWTTLAWYTTKNGNSHSGMVRMVEHVRDSHLTTDALREIVEQEEADGDAG